jgi:hypothetical protein
VNTFVSKEQLLEPSIVSNHWLIKERTEGLQMYTLLEVEDVNRVPAIVNLYQTDIGTLGMQCSQSYGPVRAFGRHDSLRRSFDVDGQ